MAHEQYSILNFTQSCLCHSLIVFLIFPILLGLYIQSTCTSCTWLDSDCHVQEQHQVVMANIPYRIKLYTLESTSFSKGIRQTNKATIIAPQIKLCASCLFHQRNGLQTKYSRTLELGQNKSRFLSSILLNPFLPGVNPLSEYLPWKNCCQKCTDMICLLPVSFQRKNMYFWL